MTATQKLIAVVLVLVVLGGGILYFSKHAQAPATTTNTATTTEQTGTATSTATSTATAAGSGLHLVQPDYKKPIAFAPNVSADIRTQLNTDLVKIQADISKNPLSIKDWVNLGTLHKMGGDYTNAALYWEYVTSIYNGSGAPFYSLGDLYENFLHDYTKAEADYKLAIQSDPHNVNAYASLYTMYHYTLKDDTKAAAILAQGLKANPGNNYLSGLQSDLQAGK